MDLLWIQFRIGGQNFFAHFRTHRHHGVSMQKGITFRPGRNAVASTELLSFPRPAGLEAVCGDNMGNSVQEARKVSAKPGVPRVGVDDISALRRDRHA